MNSVDVDKYQQLAGKINGISARGVQTFSDDSKCAAVHVLYDFMLLNVSLLLQVHHNQYQGVLSAGREGKISEWRNNQRIKL